MAAAKILHTQTLVHMCDIWGLYLELKLIPRAQNFLSWHILFTPVKEWLIRKEFLGKYWCLKKQQV